MHERVVTTFNVVANFQTLENNPDLKSLEKNFQFKIFGNVIRSDFQISYATIHSEVKKSHSLFRFGFSKKLETFFRNRFYSQTFPHIFG